MREPDRGVALAVGLRVLGTLSVLAAAGALAAGSPPAVVLPLAALALVLVVAVLARRRP